MVVVMARRRLGRRLQSLGCFGSVKCVRLFGKISSTNNTLHSSLSIFHSSFILCPIAIMLSRRALLAARTLRAYQAPQLQRQFFPVVQQFRSYADKVVKVPEMAESISEGTLKQFSKQIGDYVEQDEEIATIETDKARLIRSSTASQLREFILTLLLD